MMLHTMMRHTRYYIWNPLIFIYVYIYIYILVVGDIYKYIDIYIFEFYIVFVAPKRQNLIHVHGIMYLC